MRTRRPPPEGARVGLTDACHRFSLIQYKDLRARRPDPELRLAELAALLHLSKNAVIEKALLEMNERTTRAVLVRTAFDAVRARDCELLERLSKLSPWS